jgi:alginate O-acetyltransferase complex protein AlgI
MRPFRSFLLLLILLACLAALSFIFPGSGLFPTPADLLFPIDEPHVKEVPKPTAPDQNTTADTSLYNFEAVTNPLEKFLDSLENSDGQTRIMYYGDSQVEGDRITFNLRRLLREGREGTGPGLFLPVMPVMYTKSMEIRSSSNWERFNYLSYKKGVITNNRLGPFMSVCRYMPEGTETTLSEKASVRIQPSPYADSLAGLYDRLRIFYGKTRGLIDLSVSADGKLVLKDSLRSRKEMQEISCSLWGAKEILIEFEGRASPDIYGISIESKTGVIVDNIPQRGSAGLEFTMVDRENLVESYNLLDPDLIILHYGLNIVKNVREDYSYYKKGLKRQLAALREAAPLTPVMVIGVTDMAENSGDSIITYTNIPSIINAQREAALEENAIFWDSFAAMGGESSIVEWAHKKPALAQNDFVHFTYTGADTLSRMLVSSLFSIPAGDTSAFIETDTIPVLVTESTETRVKTDSVPGLAASLISKVFSFDPDKPFVFTAPAFWIFFLLILAGYSLIYKKIPVRNFYLLLVSLFFYYKSGGFFLFLLLLVTVIDYSCGLLIFRSHKKTFRRLFILVSILSNLGLLAYFKYSGFLITSVNELFGTGFRVYDFFGSFSNIHLGTSFDISQIILPVGISFFTFQSLSYTIDVYRRKLVPVRSITDFGFYVSFFPQLVAGPIVRASEFIPQMYAKFSLNKREFSHAMFLVAKGLIKKIIISDFIAINFVDRVFDAPSIYSGFENLMAVYGYGLQIYCDFSGYTDIAIGLALVMGFRLPVNFNSPYKAAGIADFWSRWHISLSRWLKDYLYIPLGGNRKGSIRTGINLIITMLLGGLWHGASMRFVIWGGLHGIGLVINKIWNSIFGNRLKSGWVGRAVAVFITFNFVNFCWIFFRAPDMDSVLVMLRQIAENFSPGSYWTVIPSYSTVFILMAVGYIIHFLPEKVKESYRGLFIRIPLVAQLAVILVVAVLLLQMRSADVMPFIYFRF